MSDLLTYKGEALLLSWTDSSAGRKVTFLLPDNGQQHPFKDFKTGPVHGQPFAIGCQPVDYDNPEPAPEEKKPKRDRKESETCAMLCDNPVFQEWLSAAFTLEWQTLSLGLTTADDVATRLVKQHCRMHSRKVLDSDPEGEPSKRWQRLRAQFESDTGRTAVRTR